MGKRAKTETHEQQPNWTAFQKGLYKPVDKSEIGRGMIKKNGVNWKYIRESDRSIKHASNKIRKMENKEKIVAT